MHNHNETQTLNLDSCFEHHLKRTFMFVFYQFETCFIATMARVIGWRQAEMKSHYFWLRG